MIEQTDLAAGRPGTLEKPIPYSCNDLRVMWGPLTPL
jgi:hypothetical protein